MFWKKDPIDGPDGPTFVRRSQTSRVEDALAAMVAASSRVALLPT
jgi:hypothetical protein